MPMPELPAEEPLLAAVLDSVPHGLSMWDDGLRLLLWNRSYLEIYGIPTAACRRGISLHEICAIAADLGSHSGTGAAELAASHEAGLAATRRQSSVVFEKPLGGRLVKTTFTRVAGLGCIVMHEDVSEQRRRTEALQAREAELELQNLRLSTLVNNLDMGVSMFDPARRLVICNEHYTRMYGLSAVDTQPGTPVSQIIARRLELGIVPLSGTEAYAKGLMAMIESGEPHRATTEMGDGRVISIKHTPVDDGGWVTIHRDITEEREREARIRFLARHDGLTGVANRMHLREHLDSLEPRLRRGEHIAVLYVDLDRFKAVNDTLGHGAGDEVLRQVGARLAALHRETDLIARLGGDEFAILVSPLDSPRAAAAMADRIVKAIAEPFAVNDHQVVIGASVGIAVSPVDGQDAETLMRHADLALYRAKSEGRGNFHFFESGMDAALQARRAIEVGLRQALARGEFRLMFQPVLNLAQNRISAFEALIRWDHPERGTVPPGEFIPVAEETGLIVAIGEWALREACRVAASWPQAVRVAVNLSPMQVRSRHIVEQVAAALGEAGLPAERLELEITESILLAETQHSLETLHRFRGLGVRIAMDDFGTGYSSLSYLRAFPFDKIKIDRSFMRNLSAADESLAIVRAAIGLGRSLGMVTTAEGVETEAQLDAVREEGCTEIQGYLFSPPLTPSGVAELLGRMPGRGPLRMMREAS